MSALEVSRRSLGLAAAATALGAPAALAQIRGGTALTQGDWFSQVKAQHRELDRRLGAVKAAPAGPERLRRLALFANLLASHCIAEEVVLYPGLYIDGDQAASRQLYEEQQQAKIVLAQIEHAMRLAKWSDAAAMTAKLGDALHSHVALEETKDYPELMRKSDARMNAQMTADFRDQFTRCMG